MTIQERQADIDVSVDGFDLPDDEEPGVTKSSHSREYLEEALAAAKKVLPGWAMAAIHAAALPRSGGRASATARAQRSAADTSQEVSQLDNACEPEVIKTQRFDNLHDALAWYAANGGNLRVGDLLLRARELMDAGDNDVRFATPTGAQAFVTKAAYGEIQHLVPSAIAGSGRPVIAFVGAVPSQIDAARGKPFAGMDGAALNERYLQPLGLSKHDVLLSNVIPMVGEPDASHLFDGWIQRELDAYRPRIVVALGRVAKSALGHRAAFVLPHPAAVRKLGDSGEIQRKLHKIRQALEHAKKLTHDVAISKAESSKQTVYGVVLDPYQVDTQGDWIPACEIEQTAHAYLDSSRVVGLQHVGKAEAVVVESHIVHYPSDQDYRAAMANQPHRAYRMPYGDQFIHSGAWILGTKVKDPSVWAQVEKGEIGAYSIGGSGVRTDITPAQMPSVQFIELRGFVLPGPEPEPAVK